MKEITTSIYTFEDLIKYGCLYVDKTRYFERLIKTAKGELDFFANLDYDIQIPEEKYFQSIVFTIFKMCGMKIETEEKTNIGRIDAVLTVDGHIYIIEFKLNKTADCAIVQIDDRKYEEKYILPAKEKGLTIHKLGINFSYAPGERNISDWKEDK